MPTKNVLVALDTGGVVHRAYRYRQSQIADVWQLYCGAFATRVALAPVPFTTCVLCAAYAGATVAREDG